MRIKRILSTLLTAALALTLPAGTAEATPEKQLVALRTQGLVDPIGIDTLQPEFSWQLRSETVGAAQQSYRITVTDEAGETMWDSGVCEIGVSVGIPYAGETLQPATRYLWQVTITDEGGKEIVSEPASFETSLLSTSREAWNGAEWIGAGALSLDAASACVFEISAELTIPEGSGTASLILGADDFRLKNAAFNTDAMASDENYVRVELDISGVGPEGGASLRFYRVGWYHDDPGTEPAAVIEGAEDLDALLNEGNAHEPHAISVYVCGSLITVGIDGTQLLETVSVNRLGDSSSYNTFPNLNSVGFMQPAGQTAIWRDYRIENAGKYATGTLLDETTGATLRIFEGQDGVTIDGDTITVSGGETGVIGWADPSYGGAPMLRSELTLASEPERARLYVTAHGIYDLYLNGEEVAPEEWFNPGSEEYDSIMAYNVYDVTDMLTSGANAIGAVLGEGWWTGQMTFEASNQNYYGDEPALMALLTVDYADGSTESFVTSPDTWQVSTDGAVRLASFFQGERYDAQAEQRMAGWNEPGYDASEWRAAEVIETRPQFENAALVVREDTPVHVIRELTASECLGETKPGTGAYLYDMGENLTGVPIITIPAELAEPGETLTIRYAETLYPDLEEYTAAGIDGTLMVENYRAALVTDFYTMREGEQVFAPDLTLHGYRYIEITGLSAPLPAECVGMRVLSSLDPTATYDTSNELADRLFNNIVNSATGNYISIPTDCPQRNERMGWTGDAQVFALSGTYLADTYGFLREWMDTVRADCGESGMSSQYCPAFVQYERSAPIEHKGQSFGITWNCLVVTVPYSLYRQTGRTRIVEENIDNIIAYVDTLNAKPLSYKDANGEKRTDDRLSGETGTLADHLAVVPTDSVLLGNVMYYMCLNEAAELARAVGREEKAAEYEARAKVVKQAWNELFLEEGTGITYNLKGVKQDTQASYATALRFGIISEENLPMVLENYVRTITEPTDKEGNAITPYTITTGFNATGNVLNALSDNGRSDIAYALFESTDYASWLYPVTQGATSIWERWNSYTVEDGFGGNNSMNSFNHYSLGAVYEWMIGYQLGIVSGEEAGYHRFVLQPVCGGAMTEASGSYDSEYGTIYSAWTAEAGEMTSYTATVPANTRATLYLPMRGTAGECCEGATYIGSERHNGVETECYELAAGRYVFTMDRDTIVVSGK